LAGTARFFNNLSFEANQREKQKVVETLGQALGIRFGSKQFINIKVTNHETKINIKTFEIKRRAKCLVF
jgi:hypothetical protein